MIRFAGWFCFEARHFTNKSLIWTFHSTPTFVGLNSVLKKSKLFKVSEMDQFQLWTPRKRLQMEKPNQFRNKVDYPLYNTVTRCCAFIWFQLVCAIHFRNLTMCETCWNAIDILSSDGSSSTPGPDRFRSIVRGPISPITLPYLLSALVTESVVNYVTTTIYLHNISELWQYWQSFFINHTKNLEKFIPVHRLALSWNNLPVKWHGLNTFTGNLIIEL